MYDAIESRSGIDTDHARIVTEKSSDAAIIVCSNLSKCRGVSAVSLAIFAHGSDFLVFQPFGPRGTTRADKIVHCIDAGFFSISFSPLVQQEATTFGWNVHRPFPELRPGLPLIAANSWFARS
jgi:hypothetical protein